MSTILETSHLIVRKFNIDDAPFMLRLLNEPTWIQFIGDRNVRTVQEAEHYLMNGAIKSYKDNGFGFYIVVHKETGEPVGTVGFVKRPFLECPDYGFAFLPEYTGQGYAFEVSAAAMDYAEQILQLSRIEAITTPDNKRSIHLLVKIGFRFEKSIHAEGEELFLFGKESRYVPMDHQHDH
ncbi:MAG TPA: GNAT family N-acetyltransferase [Saprospiraceae bacterium]